MVAGQLDDLGLSFGFIATDSDGTICEHYHSTAINVVTDSELRSFVSHNTIQMNISGVDLSVVGFHIINYETIVNDLSYEFTIKALVLEDCTEDNIREVSTQFTLDASHIMI